MPICKVDGSKYEIKGRTKTVMVSLKKVLPNITRRAAMPCPAEPKISRQQLPKLAPITTAMAVVKPKCPPPAITAVKRTAASDE